MVHDGTAFDARWTAQLDSWVNHINHEASLGSLTNRLGDVPIRRIHLLANVNFAPRSVPRPLEVARLLLRYQDGSTSEFPIRLGVEVEDLWSQGAKPTTGQAPVAWRGMDPSAEMSGKWVQLYHATLVNPHPDRPVTALEIRPAMVLPSLLVSGITVE